MQIGWPVLAIAFLLTIATRLFFQFMNGVALTAAATAVVAGFWLAIGLACRWLWSKRKVQHADVKG